MGTLLSLRSFRRPDQPQPVYPQVVDTTVRTWAPIWNSELNNFRTSQRAVLDVRAHEWSPEFTWVTRVNDAVVQQWGPIFSAELKGERSSDRTRLLDVRPEWVPAFTWVAPVVESTVRTWSPVFQHELRAERTRDRIALDVRSHEWSAPAWIFSALSPTVTTAQIWPALLEALGLSYRSTDRTTLDVRRYDWSANFGWSPTVVDSVVRTWLPVFDAEVGERTRDHASLDVRGQEWSAWGWLPRVSVDPIVSRWAPIWNAELGMRTPDHAALDVRAYEWSSLAWIFSSLPPSVSIAQQWPALLQALGLSYRSGDRAVLDVRGQEWAPQFGWAERVVESIVSTWSPVWSEQASSFRTPERARLDVRQFEWTPSLAWIFQNLTAVTQAQLWPAILQSLGLSYRMADRAALDVRADLWSPESGWVPKVVDGVLSRYAPIFSTELQAFRSTERAKLDVRGHEWSPEFLGVQRVVDAIVSRWAPIWQAELGLWTPGRPRLDVRPGTGSPELAWWAGFLTFIDSIPDAGVAPVGRSLVRARTRRFVGDLMQVVTTRAVTRRVVSPLIVSQSYDASVLADSPLGYWPLDDAAAPFLDHSGHQHDGTVPVAGVTAGQPSLLTDPATSVRCSGVDDFFTNTGPRVQAQTAPVFLASVSHLTVEIWVKLQTLSGALRIFYGDDSDTTWLAVHNGLASFQLLNDDFLSAEATAGAITVGPIYHVVGTYNGSVLILYLNGVEVARQAFSGLVTLYDQLLFGGTSLFGCSLNGWIQKAALYAQTLTPTQVAAHYLAGVTRPRGRLVTPITRRGTEDQ